MRTTLSQRLDRLEARNTDLRERIVWWRPERGEPEPRAAPGERLVIVRWMMSEEKPEAPMSGN